jgi:phosphoglycolate phosphatase
VPRYDAVLFDLDGCIVDSLASIIRCWNETLPTFGLAVPSEADIRAHIGPPVVVAARSFAPGADDVTVAKLAEDVAPYPGMVELLTSLAAEGMTLGLATSKSEEVALPLLDRLGLTPLFTVIEGTHVDEPGTDKATVIARAMTRLAPIRPAAHIGDREHDIEGAHANGLTAIGVLWGYGSEAELVNARADAVMSTPADLGRALVSGLGATRRS